MSPTPAPRPVHPSLYPLEVAVVGVSFHQAVVRTARVGDPVAVVFEPDNPYDANAVRIDLGGATVGHLPRGVAARLAGSATEGLHGHIVGVYGTETVGLRLSLDLHRTPDRAPDGEAASHAGAGVGPADVDSSWVPGAGDPGPGPDTPRRRTRSAAPARSAGPTRPDTQHPAAEHPTAAGDEVRVRAGGRVLGDFLGVHGDEVLVRTVTGAVLHFPGHLVETAPAST